MRAELFIDARSALGEGPVWDERSDTLYWVDITRCQVHAFQVETGMRHTWMLGQCTGAIALCEQGGFIAALTTGFYRYGADGTFTLVAQPHPLSARVRFNDGKCDPKGRFWAGTMNLFPGERNAGALYCLDTDFNLKTMISGVTCSNGLAFSADGQTMYYIDSGERCVRAFVYDEETCALNTSHVILSFTCDQGIPDGMAIDNDGMLWIAHWGGGCVGRYDPRNGSQLARVDVPARYTTSCCLGGQDMATLFITCATEDDDAPNAGGVFCAQVGVSGPRIIRFTG